MNFIRRIISYFHKIKNPISYARQIGVQLGNDCRLIGNISFGSEPYLIKLGNHVSITSSSFITHDGGIWVFRNEQPDIDVIKPIIIGNNVFIGADCIILPGVVIEDNVVVGAKSLVTKKLDSGFIYGGVPARKIKSIEEYYDGNKDIFIKTKTMSAENKKIFLLNKFFDLVNRNKI